VGPPHVHSLHYTTVFSHRLVLLLFALVAAACGCEHHGVEQEIQTSCGWGCKNSRVATSVDTGFEHDRTVEWAKPLGMSGPPAASSMNSRLHGGPTRSKSPSPQVPAGPAGSKDIGLTSAKPDSKRDVAEHGWQQVVSKKKQRAKETPVAPKRDQLIQENWDVTIAASVADLAVNVAGVAIAHSHKEAREALEELKHAQAKIAIVTCYPCGRSEQKNPIPVVDADGRKQIRMRYMLQLGPLNKQVVCETGSKQVSFTPDMSSIVISVVKHFCSAEVWECARSSPKESMRKWLQARAGAQPHTMSMPVDTGRTCAGKPVFQLIVRVPRSSADAVLQASGQDGVFARPFFTQNERLSDGWKPVWLPANADLASAMRQANRIQDSRGLAFNRTGLGILVPTANAEHICREILGETAATNTTGDLYEMSGVPASCGEGALSRVLIDWGWQDARPLKPIGAPRNGQLHWLIRSTRAPPHPGMLQHANGLSRVERAKPPPSKPTTTTRRWTPHGTNKNTLWPEAWESNNGTATKLQDCASRPQQPHGGQPSQAQPPSHPRTSAPSGPSPGHDPAAQSQTTLQQARPPDNMRAMTALPTTQSQTTMLDTLILSPATFSTQQTQPADNMMAMIALAVSAAIGPLQQQLLQLKSNFETFQMEQGGPDESDSENEDLEPVTQGAPKRQRRKLTIANP